MTTTRRAKNETITNCFLSHAQAPPGDALHRTIHFAGETIQLVYSTLQLTEIPFRQFPAAT